MCCSLHVSSIIRVLGTKHRSRCFLPLPFSVTRGILARKPHSLPFRWSLQGTLSNGRAYGSSRTCTPCMDHCYRKRTLGILHQYLPRRQDHKGWSSKFLRMCCQQRALSLVSLWSFRRRIDLGRVPWEMSCRLPCMIVSLNSTHSAIPSFSYPSFCRKAHRSLSSTRWTRSPAQQYWWS